jgi:hypothetical protein
MSNLTPLAQSGDNEPWRSVELTEDEAAQALDKAKKEKYYADKDRLERQKYNQFVEFMRSDWTVDHMLGFVVNVRAGKCGMSRNGGQDGRRVFTIDDHNAWVLEALCMYFTDDPLFESIHLKDDTGRPVHKGWKLDKGIMLVGGVGIGKTQLMRMLRVNKKACFDVVNCADLSKEFAKTSKDAGGYAAVERFENIHRKDIKNIDNFWQEDMGICFDDLGTESDKTHFGNKANVIADVILGRYANRLPFYYTHATTNLTPGEMKEIYGVRFFDRVGEMFNIIKVTGESRRGR